MRFTVTSLIALAAEVASVAQPTPELPANLPLTNAKRFAVGLPPLPPKLRHRGFPHDAAGSKVDTARRAVSSPSVPISTNCNILLSRTSDRSPLGFIGPVWGSNGVYNQLQSVQAGSLEVKVTYTVDGFSQLDVISTGAATASFPFLGIATLGSSMGAANLGPGILRYFYVTGISTGTPKGSIPTQTTSSYSTLTGIAALSESAIWRYDPVTQVIAPQWVNPDGTQPATFLAYTTGARGLMATGDLARLATTIPSAVPVSLTCVPAVLPV